MGKSRTLRPQGHAPVGGQLDPGPLAPAGGGRLLTSEWDSHPLPWTALEA